MTSASNTVEKDLSNLRIVQGIHERGGLFTLECGLLYLALERRGWLGWCLLRFLFHLLKVMHTKHFLIRECKILTKKKNFENIDAYFIVVAALTMPSYDQRQ